MLWVTPIWAPVAVRFWTAAWNWAVSWMKTTGTLPAWVKAPAWNPLLNGVSLWPHNRLVVKAVSKVESACAIWVSWMAGS